MEYLLDIKVCIHRLLRSRMKDYFVMCWNLRSRLLAMVFTFVVCCAAGHTANVGNPLAEPAAPQKVIALTFDDGPRPWVLKGNSEPGHASPSLLELLARQNAKATFFVMGWRLVSYADKDCRKIDVGITCRQAVEEEHRSGLEVENHTYG